MKIFLSRDRRARASQTGTVGRRARPMGASESPRRGDRRGERLQGLSPLQGWFRTWKNFPSRDAGARRRESPAKRSAPPEALFPATVYRDGPPRIHGIAGEGRPAEGAFPGDGLQGRTSAYTRDRWRRSARRRRFSRRRSTGTDLRVYTGSLARAGPPKALFPATVYRDGPRRILGMAGEGWLAEGAFPGDGLQGRPSL